jgi:hypothetical protein
LIVPRASDLYEQHDALLFSLCLLRTQRARQQLRSAHAQLLSGVDPAAPPQPVHALQALHIRIVTLGDCRKILAAPHPVHSPRAALLLRAEDATFVLLTVVAAEATFVLVLVGAAEATVVLPPVRGIVSTFPGRNWRAEIPLFALSSELTLTS